MKEGIRLCVAGFLNMINTIVSTFSSYYNVLFYISNLIMLIDPRLKSLFLDGFELMCLKNQPMLWQAQSLQRTFMKFNLGDGYWDMKMNQFKLVREEMGIKLV